MGDLERGFISKEKILSYVTEEDIFKLVFGIIPDHFECVTSPFRKDNNPGCWFQVGLKGDLRFVDFANNNTINGISMINIDCFNAVQIYYGLGNFYRTLEYIYNTLILGRNLKRLPVIGKNENQTLLKKLEFSVTIEARNFESRDARYWKRYGVSKQNLIEDKVFPVLRYKMLNTKYGDFLERPRTLCYAYTNFKLQKKKLYFPYKKGKYRFITDCKENDIGEIESLPDSGDLLIITKSYKDCRVLRNLGYNSVWLQAEVMFPSNNELISLCNRFKKVIVLFDNDKTGVTMSKRLNELINTFLPDKSIYLYVPENLNERGISDPADMYHKMGVSHLRTFLKKYV